MSSKAYSSDVAELFVKGEIVDYPKHQIIVHAADAVEHMYRIVEGFVKIYSINSRGDEQVHLVAGPGDIFPVTLFIDDHPSNIFYQTLTDSRIARILFSTINKVLQSDVELTYAMLQKTVEQYRVYAARVYSLEYRFARERLAHRLLTLAGRFGKRTSMGIELQAPLTQQVIASSINLSRETVSREMERMVHKGYLKEISRSGKPLVILDPNGLASEIPGMPMFIENSNKV